MDSRPPSVTAGLCSRAAAGLCPRSGCSGCSCSPQGRWQRWAAIACLALVQACGLFSSMEMRCGTEVADPDEVVAGCLVHEGGNPAVGVLVKAVPLGAADLGDSTRTDALGKYGFLDLPPGVYDIVATGESGTASLRTKVEVSRFIKSFFVKPDTLRPAGSIAGTLLIPEGDPALPDAECAILGSHYSARTDDTGAFRISIPAGRYSVLCLLAAPDKDHNPVMESVSVESGRETRLTLTATLKVDKTPPPAPASLAWEYDSATGTVRLRWPKVTMKEPFQYAIRLLSGDIHPDLPIRFTMDTLYEDRFYADRSDTLAMILFYSVTCFKNGQVFGEWVYAKPLRITPPPAPGAEIALRLLSPASPSVGDTARVVGEYRNPLRNNRSLSWTLKGRAGPVRVKALSDRNGADTLLVPCEAAGDVEARLSIQDESGSATSSGLIFSVRPARPRP